MQLNLLETPLHPQNNIDNSSSAKHDAFRTIHYLGSKLRVLHFIKKIADKIDPSRGAVCDLFAGSGAVSQKIANDRRIIAVDIQEYSRVLCTSLLKPCSSNELYVYGSNCRDSSINHDLLDALTPIINYEDFVISQGSTGKLEPICDFLENGSLYSAISDFPVECSSGLAPILKETIKRTKKLTDIPILATTYFGGIYYSYKQALHIDVILNEIAHAPSRLRSSLMAALLSTASDLVNTVGKQFAQPIRPRNKDGKPKKGLISQLQKDRRVCVFETFENWLRKYSNISLSSQNHEVWRMDYSNALDLLPDDVTIVYADPPYTRDHYSRFYHGLETLCLNDFPKISKTNIGGITRLSRGLYRNNRHQSPFCIKSEAPGAFDNLFKKVSNKGKILMLSYSPYNEKKNSHPRVMKLEQLMSLANKYFTSTEICCPGVFTHSKLNKTERHLEANDYGEIILVCKN